MISKTTNMIDRRSANGTALKRKVNGVKTKTKWKKRRKATSVLHQLENDIRHSWWPLRLLLLVGNAVVQNLANIKVQNNQTVHEKKRNYTSKTSMPNSTNAFDLQLWACSVRYQYDKLQIFYRLFVLSVAIGVTLVITLLVARGVSSKWSESTLLMTSRADWFLHVINIREEKAKSFNSRVHE